MESLSENQKDIIYFFESVTNSKNFRQQVLFSLAEIFNLEYSTFFLIDSGGNLFNPVALNVESRSTNSYVEHYQEKDIFHPRNLPGKKFMTNPVMYITDVMPLKEYEQTEYYNDFIKKQGFYHEIIITLTEKGKLQGGIGLYKPRNECFDHKTIKLLKLINRFLERQLSQHLALQRARAHEQIYQHCINKSATGIILFDRNFSVLYSNDAAAEMVAALLHKRLSLGEFVKHTLSLTGNLHNPYKASSLTLYSPSLSEFTVRVTPATGGHDSDRETFLMELLPEDLPRKLHTGTDKPVNENIKEEYNLSERELQVLGLIMQGLTNAEAARILYISPNTVKAHLRNILKKTGTDNRMKLSQKIMGATLPGNEL